MAGDLALVWCLFTSFKVGVQKFILVGSPLVSSCYLLLMCKVDLGCCLLDGD